MWLRLAGGLPVACDRPHASLVTTFDLPRWLLDKLAPHVLSRDYAEYELHIVDVPGPRSMWLQRKSDWPDLRPSDTSSASFRWSLFEKFLVEDLPVNWFDCWVEFSPKRHFTSF